MPQLSRRVQLFTDSVIRRMTRISEQYDAINLSQGYPDFDPPRPCWTAWPRWPMRAPTSTPSPMGPRTCGRPWRTSTAGPPAGPWIPTPRCWSPAAAPRP